MSAGNKTKNLIGVTLVKISSTELENHPAYIALNLEQAQCICKLLGTDSTVWTQKEIDSLGDRAAKGEFDMIFTGPNIIITFK